MPSQPPPIEVAPGLYTIDSGYVRPGLDAVHLLVAGDRAAFIDTGTSASVPAALTALDALGIDREAVQHVILTHIHLDHAGGASGLMAALPEATLIVHPRGARHMADPRKLVAGSVAVYGEAAFRALYGEVHPIDADRIQQTEDGGTVALGDRQLRILHTPGHAKHHHCIVDDTVGGVFTGDTFGLAYPELAIDGRPFVFPTTTPVHFDPEAAHHSIDRIVAQGHDTAFLTHYGRIDGLAAAAADLHAHLDAFVGLTEASRTAPEREEALTQAITAHLVDAAVERGHTAERSRLAELVSLDARLNAQGLVFWDRKRTG